MDEYWEHVKWLWSLSPVMWITLGVRFSWGVTLLFFGFWGVLFCIMGQTLAFASGMYIYNRFPLLIENAKMRVKEWWEERPNA